ncbi:MULTISPECIES: VRR-NUC domain-containing protein [unclassified Modicisalibacter]|uniref:VRR-NUC domain-containing protein n=1 Tax=unclassified Modicisalibacter TaxID=2679913 RepID=UPI001CCFAEC7|nr:MULTISPECIES: VRR-NUC domain-containing protein [unclassified Modicisalibacter]MBZ9559408.1 VRR-NUC domain-containing protein [Modicisalibacter sp. R2A 31.J]MBZ9576426.1 VRR-NUC domain-containing protein [Modicisalibacter sp. MOD 31.J]
MARPTLDDPLYYLHNFRFVLRWLETRYTDLLADDERAFIEDFAALPEASQALLVRMTMRKGALFRASRLRYAEIGDTPSAAAPLIERGFVEAGPPLSLEALFGLLTKAELARLFGERLTALGLGQARKDAWLTALGEAFTEPRTPPEWGLDDEPVYALHVEALGERLRLMFFGNLRQDWSEFVLADLGVARYEPVDFSPASRAFQQRDEIDTYLHLQRCRERLDAEEAPVTIRVDVPDTALANPWLEARRARLLYRLAQQAERRHELTAAETLYAESAHPGARGRRLRMLERLERFEAALALAREIHEAPESEAERQQVRRVLPRLHRRLGLARPSPAATSPVVRLDLTLPPGPGRVEFAVRRHLATPEGPVHYVENTLIGGLFGLLCWDAIFAPLPGAFFHPFQSGPADLGRADFRERRAALFDACLARLDDGTYRQTIRRHHRAKAGRLSPFVDWAVLDDTLLEQALTCLPPAHLRLCFERLLDDVTANRAGLPDLIQLWPDAGRYRMIEVKGPGDRLQDNQRRWLDFFHRHGMPVAVCHVRWAEAGEA